MGVMFLHCPVGVMMQDRGIEGYALLALRWRMRQSRADFGHRSRSPDDLWLILLPLTPLF